MSFTPTTNYALQKPDVNTELDAWGDELNDNWDAVDNQLKINADAIAAVSTVAANSVDNTKLANMPSNTIKGCITAGDPVDLTATQVSTILGLSGTIADGSVTNAKLANMPANTLKGVSVAGVPTDLTAAQVSTILGLGGAATILDDSVTNLKLANMAANTIKGSVAGGDPADLTAAQVLAITGLTDVATKETQNAQSGNYTLVVGDAGKMVTFSGTATLTINSGVFSAGHRIDILQLGSGAVTFGGTATRRVFPSGATKLAGQYAGATIWFTTTANECVIIGNIIV